MLLTNKFRKLFLNFMLAPLTVLKETNSEDIGSYGRTIVLIIIALLHVHVCGAELSVEKGAVRVRGFLRATDAVVLEKLISKADVGEIVFGDSLGGTAEAARAYARLIREAKFNTQVKGKCFSACAIAFAAGIERTFAGGPQVHMLIFHMGRTEKGGVVTQYAENSQLFALLDNLTDGKIREPARSLIKNSWSAATGVLFSSEPGFFSRKIKSLYCDGTQGHDGNKCIKLENSGPLEMGIVTKL